MLIYIIAYLLFIRYVALAHNATLQTEANNKDNVDFLWEFLEAPTVQRSRNHTSVAGLLSIRTCRTTVTLTSRVVEELLAGTLKTQHLIFV